MKIKKPAQKEVIDKLYSSKKISDLTKIEKRDELLTSITSIDTDFGFPSGFYVICGNPGAGKGWFALWLSRMSYIHNQKKSVYFSLEMSEQLVRSRILQQWSDLTKTEYESKISVAKALELIAQDVIIVDTFYNDDQKKQTPDSFMIWVDEYYKIGYRIFHFDHLHELDGANDNKKNQGVTERWAKVFQNICKKYSDLWLFVYVQPNGAAANKNILRRTDIAGSKAITQKCDFFMSLNREVKLDEMGLVEMNTNSRKVFLFLDKTRYTDKTHIGFALHFSYTGNYFSYTERNDD